MKDMITKIDNNIDLPWDWNKILLNPNPVHAKSFLAELAPASRGAG